MRIILDENVPFPLAAHLAPHEVTTVQEQNWAGLQNGDLLPHLEGRFDVFVLADKNMRYQQNLTARTVAFVELPTNRWPLLLPLIPRIIAAVKNAKVGSYTVIDL